MSYKKDSFPNEMYLFGFVFVSIASIYISMI